MQCNWLLPLSITSHPLQLDECLTCICALPFESQDNTASATAVPQSGPHLPHVDDALALSKHIVLQPRTARCTFQVAAALGHPDSFRRVAQQAVLQDDGVPMFPLQHRMPSSTGCPAAFACCRGECFMSSAVQVTQRYTSGGRL